MKGSFIFSMNSFPSEFRERLLKLANSKKAFPITIDDAILFLVRMDKLTMETKLTSDTMEIDYAILNNSIVETPFYKWVKERYPDILMEYALLGNEDLEKEAAK
jgi:hypothetical protein